jgi:hypothetical protein
MPTTAQKLKKIRESLPGRPGVRRIAEALGYSVQNRYGYYEGTQFKKDTLPLDMAREIAAVFAQLGGDPSEVLALGGLTKDETDREVAMIERPAPFQFVRLDVALPNANALTDMFRQLLRSVGQPQIADEVAPWLARRLPSALAEAQIREPELPSADEGPSDDDSPQPPAKPRRGRAQQPST